MNRREALSRVSLILGGTIVGAEFFLSGCETRPLQLSTLEFTDNNVTFLDEVGETILPTTPDSPGAKAAEIGKFMRTIVTDCYDAEEQTIFLNGIGELNEAAKKTFQKEFLQLDDAQKKEFLTEIDGVAKEHAEKMKAGDKAHYFSMMKQLTLWGYFSSKIGATQALRYVEVPGRYEGCIPYTKGEKAWALS
ncbi:MAG: gluconate 2-dehydrogenase subunit 3 family protein [Bacteroidia bacterium]|nr:gluconate 2-dehydrogenase subunit 3 family protein [Bacteroidia bacterium]